MLWTMRHGERGDLEDKNSFIEHNKRFASTDPPLTNNGRDMAFKSGQYLKQKLLNDYPNKKFMVISSPYYRCIQTSIEVMKGITTEHLKTNTLYLEDGFQEFYDEADAMICPNNLENLVIKKIDDGDTNLKCEVFGDIDYSHNTLLDYTKKSPWSPVWPETWNGVKNRYVFRTQEVSDLYSKSEYNNTIFIVISHGIWSKLSRCKASREDMNDCFYCSMYNFTIEKNINSTSEEDTHNWHLIEGEIAAYEYKEIKNFNMIYLTHTLSCDRYDPEAHKKHVELGFSDTDSPATKIGKDIAVKTGQHLASELKSGKFLHKKKFMVISSPYQSCLETSKAIIDGFGKELLYNNNIYVEDGFEEHFSEAKNLNENSKKNRTFNKFDSDPSLKEKIIGDIGYTNNSLFNYEWEFGSLCVRWQEPSTFCYVRFKKRFLEVRTIVARDVSLNDVMVIVVSHDTLADVLKFENTKDYAEMRFASFSLLNLVAYGVDASQYNGIAYDLKILEKEEENC